MSTRASVAAQVLKAAWMSVLLGVLMQAITTGIALAAGKDPAGAALLASAVGKISWATLVCVGLAVAMAIPRPLVGGTALAGLLSAPIAFHGARAVNQMVGSVAGLSPDSPPTQLLLALTVIKGLEYAALGGSLAWLETRGSPTFKLCVGTGLAHGVLFGAALVGAAEALAPAARPTVAVVTQAVNELLFPIGCAVIIYAATGLGAKLETLVDGAASAD